jgi:MEMO1 family protein
MKSISSLIIRLLSLSYLCIMSSTPGLFGQGNLENRLPAVAGQFYPGQYNSLKRKLDLLHQSSEKIVNQKGHIRALLVPHAGYEYSGEVAAAGYRQIENISDYKNIFILASSHHVSTGNASIYAKGHYETPLGTAKVNIDLAQELIAKHDVFSYAPTAHSQEHSIEVQIPFLQNMSNTPPIIPIVICSQVPSVCEDVALALKPYFTDKNLFIVSADFSHFPKYEDAVEIDQQTAAAFCSGSPDEFMRVIRGNSEKKIKNLATSMCAWPAALTILYLSSAYSDLSYNSILYKNSGDHPFYGNKDRVVGYHAITLRNKDNQEVFILTEDDKKSLLAFARKTLKERVHIEKVAKIRLSDFNKNLRQKAGAFVTLKSNSYLRGCIGSFDSKTELIKVVQSMTIAAATSDHRFLPVRSSEIDEIHIEISVLTPMIRIYDISVIEPGKHGVYIRKNGKSGTFLPQVATEFGWSTEEFLGHCAKDKVGIGWEGWRDAEIYIYEAIVFSE